MPQNSTSSYSQKERPNKFTRWSTFRVLLPSSGPEPPAGTLPNVLMEQRPAFTENRSLIMPCGLKVFIGHLAHSLRISYNLFYFVC